MDFSVLGSFGLIVSASIMVPVFAGFSLMYNISRDAVTQPLSEVTVSLIYYLNVILLIYAVLLVGAVVVGFYFEALGLAILIFVVVLLEHLNNDLYVLLLNLSKPLLANFLHFLRSAAWMLLFMVAATLMPDVRALENILIGWIVGGILSFAVFLWFSRGWPWDTTKNIEAFKNWVAREFKKSRIVYAHNFVGTISQNIDRFIISYFLGLDLTGVYVFFGSVMSALINLLRTGVVQIARPSMIRAYKAQDESFKILYRKCMKQTVVFAICMAFLAWPLMYALILFMDKPLAGEWFSVFWLVLITFLFVIIVEVNRLIFYAAHRDDLILKQSLLILPISIICHCTFVILLGFLGAVLSPVLVSSLTVIIQRRQMRHIL